MESKLNQLLRDLPKGTVATQNWLKERGIYRQLTNRYVKSNWLEPFDRGVFIRKGDTVDCFGAIYALQEQLELQVHIGAITALNFKGYGHFLPMNGRETVHLFGVKNDLLPLWFTRHSWERAILYHNIRLFNNSNEIGYTDIDRGSFVVRASSPERAIMEQIRISVSNAAFDHTLELFHGLSSLRPNVVQTLLESCRSVKVKRFFLWAAEYCGHDWVNRLDTSKLNLGSGKRRIYTNGRFDKKYKITVPLNGYSADV